MPVTLKGELLELRFEADANVDIRLSEITGTNDNGEFTFQNRFPTWKEGDARLWEIQGTLSGSQETYCIGPPDAQLFSLQKARGTKGEDALLLRWTGVKVPHAIDQDEFWVAISVSIAQKDEVSRWLITIAPTPYLRPSLTIL